VKGSEKLPLVTTIKEQCRVCYTCVRDCPAKAIRIADGQAEVISERCIGCGNCVRVCTQKAKQVMSSTAEVEALLAGPAPVAACIAPSFPAEFTEVPYERLVGMVRALGFAYVNEVAFGADLVAGEYRKLLAETNGQRWIATTCPALVAYVERYHPTIVDRLAPIVSPMVALARALRRLHGGDLKVVFIGPCIAKKGEAVAEPVEDEVDAVITFTELRELFAAHELTTEGAQPSEFDPPRAGAGALFPISRGILQAAAISEDLLTGDVIAADGRSSFVEAIKEFETGDLNARLLEVLCCHGCIMGSGMSTQEPLFSRRASVSQHVRRRTGALDLSQWRADMDAFADLNLRRTFAANDQRVPPPSDEELAGILARLGKLKPEDELNCGACGYDTCREHAIAIHRGLAETEMCLPYNIDQLRTTVQELALSHEQLANAQEALMQSEKLASMGQLAAGIAHEVNNPLGVVLMYAHLLLDEAGEDQALRGDLTMIAEQADRCKKIVSGLLNFARQTKVLAEATDLRELVERSLRSAPAPASIAIKVEADLEDPMADLDPNQVTQVLTNLFTNSYAAMPDGGTLTVRVEGDETDVRLIVADTGVGIPQENLNKIFEPFFTTKQIGKGTGLGLAVTYGIVKMHRGDIQVSSNADPAAGPTGTTFTVTLPRHARQEAEPVAALPAEDLGASIPASPG
jgi:signal transduction histidine kinase/iron only hydrogenase large subunit-like protein